MKVVLYMAITPNGMIATQKDDTSWVSKADWKSFRRAVRKYGNMVVGRRTWEVIQKNNEPIPKCDVVVVSRKKNPLDKEATCVSSPAAAIAYLKRKGFNVVLVAGGGKNNASFMKLNLVDELFLDVMPTVLGDGIPLFRGKDFQRKLWLLNVKRLAKNEVQLHYRVLK